MNFNCSLSLDVKNLLHFFCRTLDPPLKNVQKSLLWLVILFVMAMFVCGIQPKSFSSEAELDLEGSY